MNLGSSRMGFRRLILPDHRLEREGFEMRFNLRRRLLLPVFCCAMLCALMGAALESTKTASPDQAANAAKTAKTAIKTAAKTAVKIKDTPSPDLSQTPTLYVVGYAHLDTEWRWEYPQVIQEYLSKTLRSNFALFEKYPHYIFNFTGANRYRLIKEYYPADFEKLKQYVAAGRWFPAGSSMEEGDVNSPNAESIFRQILYGNEFYRREFGTASEEYMLPDCFGFPASLPSILAHAGIKGFSTQKLSSGWQPAPHVGGPDSPEKTPEGIPFNVGFWEGTDGKTVIAALNPLSYTSQVSYDISKSPAPPPPSDPLLPPGFPTRGQEDWVKRIEI